MSDYLQHRNRLQCNKKIETVNKNKKASKSYRMRKLISRVTVSLDSNVQFSNKKISDIQRKTRPIQKKNINEQLFFKKT